MFSNHLDIHVFRNAFIEHLARLKNFFRVISWHLNWYTTGCFVIGRKQGDTSYRELGNNFSSAVKLNVIFFYSFIKFEN